MRQASSQTREHPAVLPMQHEEKRKGCNWQCSVQAVECPSRPSGKRGRRRVLRRRVGLTRRCLLLLSEEVR